MADFDINKIKEQQELLRIEEELWLSKSLNSNDPQAILKAQTYIQSLEKAKESNVKSFLFSPEQEFFNSLGYKGHPTNISYQTLRNMARTPIIRSIVKTRTDQVAAFSHYSEDEQKEGWQIKPKRRLFEETKALSTQQKRDISKIVQFLEDAGESQTKWQNDDFETFLRKITKDSLELDQMCWENVYNNRGQLTEFLAVDGATFRLAESYDDRDGQTSQYKDIKGYYPSYVQVYNQRTHNVFYPWELCFGIRNTSTSIWNNGYGISELEDLIQIVTWLLYGMQYNGNFFKQGSNPKGILAVKGNVDAAKLNSLKQMWRSTVAGVQNAHKMPVIDGGMDYNWINLQGTNKDMEFSQWNDFLMVIACSVFTIDPSECGFNLSKSSTIFGQDGQRLRLEHSLSKGLTPILVFLEKKINKYIVSQIGEGYEFSFTGVEKEDKKEALDQDVKKLNAGFVSLEDMFKKYSGRELNKEKDSILNSIWLQLQQMQQMGGDQSNEAVDQMNQEQGTEEDQNPFQKSLITLIDKELNATD